MVAPRTGSKKTTSSQQAKTAKTTKTTKTTKAKQSKSKSKSTVKQTSAKSKPTSKPAKAAKTTTAKAKAKSKSKAKDDKLIKVCLCNQGEDSETPWAIDLGPATGKSPAGSRRVRLVNVPFFHAKPTWGDEIIVSPAEDGQLTWDAGGVEWSKIDTLIEKDGGRYAMIVDYIPDEGDESGDIASKAIAAACHAGRTDLQTAPIVCEHCYGPSGDRTAGRVYLAVEDGLEPEDAMERLRDANPPCKLVQIHPEIDEDDEDDEPSKSKSTSKSKSSGKQASKKRR